MADEIWKPVVGYEGKYEVSNLGNVRSLDYRHTKTTHIIAKTYDSNGYFKVNLKVNGVAKNLTIHRLVAMAFIPNPNGFNQVNHKDENKENNNVENLEWCTASYNSSYGTRPSRLSKHFKNYSQYSKPVIHIGLNNVETYYPSMKEAERATGIKQGNISNCCNGKQKCTKGNYFKYA